jgi:hypothetical protein
LFCENFIVSKRKDLKKQRNSSHFIHQMTDAKRVDSDALVGVQLKKIDAPAPRPLPTAEELAAAKKLAEEEPEPIPKELLPKTGAGETHLDLIKAGGVELKKVSTPAERPLPTAEEIAAEKAASSGA